MAQARGSPWCDPALSEVRPSTTPTMSSMGKLMCFLSFGVAMSTILTLPRGDEHDDDAKFTPIPLNHITILTDDEEPNSQKLITMPFLYFVIGVIASVIGWIAAIMFFCLWSITWCRWTWADWRRRYGGGAFASDSQAPPSRNPSQSAGNSSDVMSNKSSRAASVHDGVDSRQGPLAPGGQVPDGDGGLRSDNGHRAPDVDPGARSDHSDDSIQQVEALTRGVRSFDDFVKSQAKTEKASGHHLLSSIRFCAVMAQILTQAV